MKTIAPNPSTVAAEKESAGLIIKDRPTASPSGKAIGELVAGKRERISDAHSSSKLKNSRNSDPEENLGS